MADSYDQARVGPERRTEVVADLPTAGTSTTADIEAKVNEILEALRKAGFIKS